MVNEIFYKSQDELFASLTQQVCELLTGAIAQRGTAIFLVSGGTSPRALYESLAQCDVEWSKVVVALVDERWVASDHEASNEAFIRRHLLTSKASKATLIAMKTDSATAQTGLAGCEARYAALPENADVCLLGMGTDGHTASLFPHAEGLKNALAENSPRCAAIKAKSSSVTGKHTERMTLTLSYLSRSRHRLLLITGDEKLAVYRKALACDDVISMPVRALLEAPTEVHWAPGSCRNLCEL